MSFGITALGWAAIGVAVVGSATAISLGAASAANQKKAARKQLEAQAMSTKTAAEQRIKSIRRLASQQKSSFLSSGISLSGDGTTQAVLDDTYDTGIADVNNILKNGQVGGESIASNARAKMMSTYGDMASSVSSYASMGLSGAGSLDSAGAAVDGGAGSLQGMGEGYGDFEGMGAGSAFGSGKGGVGTFDNFDPSMAKGFGGI